jgi:hypothetical protein
MHSRRRAFGPARYLPFMRYPILLLLLAACSSPTTAPHAPTATTLQVTNASLIGRIISVSVPPPGSQPLVELGSISLQSIRCVLLPATSDSLYVNFGGVPPSLTTFTLDFRPADAQGWATILGDVVQRPMPAPSSARPCTP